MIQDCCDVSTSDWSDWSTSKQHRGPLPGTTEGLQQLPDRVINEHSFFSS